MSLQEAFIIDGIRSPIGNFAGTLSEVRADDLAALVLKELLNRNPTIDPAAIEDLVMGCANQAGEDNRNVARMSLLLAGYPQTVPGQTINRLCASGLNASMEAARGLMTGDGMLYVAGGIEHMTRGPWVMNKTSSAFGRDAQLFDSSFGWRFINPKMKALYGVDSMGETAENVADLYKINREDQDAFALHSQQKATKAMMSGRLAEEIISVNIPQKKGDPKVFNADEFIKSNSSMEIQTKYFYKNL